MEDINYPTAYALHGITKFTGHSMCGLPIIGTECFVVMPCYITKHIIKYDYDGKTHQEYEVIFMKKQIGNDFIETEDVLFEEPQLVNFITDSYEEAKKVCELENKKILVGSYHKVAIKDIPEFKNEFYKKQEQLQDKVNGCDISLKKSRKDYNEQI